MTIAESPLHTLQLEGIDGRRPMVVGGMASLVGRNFINHSNSEASERGYDTKMIEVADASGKILVEDTVVTDLSGPKD